MKSLLNRALPILALIAVAALSVTLGHHAGPEDTGLWKIAHEALEDTGILNAILATCLLTVGVLIFDALWLPQVSTWQLIRSGTVRVRGTATKEGRRNVVDMPISDRLRSDTMRLQGRVLAAFIIALGFILWVSVAA